MKTKEEIIHQYYDNGSYDVGYSEYEVEKMMDEYAIGYLSGFLTKWCKLTEKEAMDLIDSYHSEDVKTSA